MLLSLDYQNYHTEILTADAQFSYKDGVIVLVTGCLNGSNNVRRKFTQSFFLFPQDKRYYVLNDVFRYVDDETSNDPNGSSPTLPLTPSIGMFCDCILILFFIIFPNLFFQLGFLSCCFWKYLLLSSECRANWDCWSAHTDSNRVLGAGRY